MPKLSKQFHLDITVEQFLNACSYLELQELSLQLDSHLRRAEHDARRRAYREGKEFDPNNPEDFSQARIPTGHTRMFFERFDTDQEKRDEILNRIDELIDEVQRVSVTTESSKEGHGAAFSFKFKNLSVTPDFRHMQEFVRLSLEKYLNGEPDTFQITTNEATAEKILRQLRYAEKFGTLRSIRLFDFKVQIGDPDTYVVLKMCGVEGMPIKLEDVFWLGYLSQVHKP